MEMNKDEQVAAKTPTIKAGPTESPEETSTKEDVKYGTEAEQVATFGRRIVPLRCDGNSFFESIARQIPDPKITKQYLRGYVTYTARLKKEEYYEFTPLDWDFFEIEMDNLKTAYYWSPSVWCVALMMFVRQLKIGNFVVIRDHAAPYYFPKEHQRVDRDTIMIVQSKDMSHYNATELIVDKEEEFEKLMRITNINLDEEIKECQDLLKSQFSKVAKRPVKRAFRKNVIQQEVIQKRYGSVTEQLTTIGRKIDPVPPDGNCMFVSISRQLADPSYTHEVLRQMTCQTGRKHAAEYCLFTELGLNDFLNGLKQLAKDGVWNLEIADVAITMLHDALGMKIVVVRSRAKPQHFPADGRPIDRDTVVIAQDDLHTHYDATVNISSVGGRRIHASLKGERVSPVRTTRQQLDAAGRELVMVNDDKNSLFASVAEQLSDVEMTAIYLRQLTYCTGLKKLVHFAQMLNVDDQVLHEELERMNEDMAWISEPTLLIIPILQEALDVKIVVIQNNSQPLHYPDDGTTIDDTTAVIVRDDPSVNHFDSTKPKGTILQPTMGLEHTEARKRYPSGRGTPQRPPSPPARVTLQRPQFLRERARDRFITQAKATSLAMATPLPKVHLTPKLPTPTSKLGAAGTGRSDTLVQQLSKIGRVLRPVPRDKISLFSSISCQIASRKTSPQYLIKILHEESLNSRYKQASSEMKRNRLALGNIENNPDMTPGVRSLAVTILAQRVKRKIVILRSLFDPQYFPSNDASIDSNTIVIVQDFKDKSHFDATKDEHEDIDMVNDDSADTDSDDSSCFPSFLNPLQALCIQASKTRDQSSADETSPLLSRYAADLPLPETLPRRQSMDRGARILFDDDEVD